jgi:hypothetical protein
MPRGKPAWSRSLRLLKPESESRPSRTAISTPHNKVVGSIRNDQLEPQSGMQCGEGRQAGDDFAYSEGTRHRHSQQALQAVDAARRVLGIIEIVQDLARAFE